MTTEGLDKPAGWEEAETARYVRRAVWCILAALAVVMLLSAFATRGFLGDELTWNTQAREWLAGFPPYGLHPDNKPPGIIYVHLLSNFLFGVQPYAPRLLAALLQLCGALAVYDIARRRLFAIQRLWCLGAYAVLCCLPSTDVGNGGTTEAFMQPFAALAFWLYSRRPEGRAGLKYAVLAGLAMGAAICFKQIAATSLLALMLLAVLECGVAAGLREAVVMFASASLFNVLMLVPVMLSGISPARIFYALFLMPAATIGRFAGPAVETGTSWIVWLEWAPVLVFTFAVLARDRRAWPFLLWIALDCFGVNLSGEYYSHQFRQLVPSVGLGLGLALAVAFAGRDARAVARAQTVLFVALVLLGAAFAAFSLTPAGRFWLL